MRRKVELFRLDPTTARALDVRLAIYGLSRQALYSALVNAVIDTLPVTVTTSDQRQPQEVTRARTQPT
jgi:hypothetical protein